MYRSWHRRAENSSGSCRDSLDHTLPPQPAPLPIQSFILC